MSVNASTIVALLFIFFARILDVSIGTVRIILVARENRYIAPLLGFFEVLIWISAVGQVIQNLNGPVSYLVYSAGFAAGNYMGMVIESMLPFGYQAIRVITKKEAKKLPRFIKEKGHWVTIVDGRGPEGKISILYTEVPRKRVNLIVEMIHRLHPKAFITI